MLTTRTLLAPYFAAKAAMHSLAYTMSSEIACWGVETTIIVPGEWGWRCRVVQKS
jgi:NAD(P)-dependent dehydrogenase (short-subunit alcohol dehydrogenase family)